MVILRKTLSDKVDKNGNVVGYYVNWSVVGEINGKAVSIPVMIYSYPLPKSENYKDKKVFEEETKKREFINHDIYRTANLLCEVIDTRSVK